MDLTSLVTWFVSLLGLGPLGPPSNILDVIRDSGATTFLSHAHRCPWVIHELGTQPGYTVLVPTNKAFEKLPKDIVDAMNSSTEVRQGNKTYHYLRK